MSDPTHNMHQYQTAASRCSASDLQGTQADNNPDEIDDDQEELQALKMQKSIETSVR